MEYILIIAFFVLLLASFAADFLSEIYRKAAQKRAVGGDISTLSWTDEMWLFMALCSIVDRLFLMACGFVFAHIVFVA